MLSTYLIFASEMGGQTLYLQEKIRQNPHSKLNENQVLNREDFIHRANRERLLGCFFRENN